MPLTRVGMSWSRGNMLRDSSLEMDSSSFSCPSASSWDISSSSCFSCTRSPCMVHISRIVHKQQAQKFGQLNCICKRFTGCPVTLWSARWQGMEA